jgi:transketolase
MNPTVIPVGELEAIARRIRIQVVKMIGCSGVGHLGGSMSIVEILAVLYLRELRIDPRDPDWPDRDRFVLSKGHGCTALYAILAEVGILPKEVLSTLHEIDSPLQMHPERGVCPGIEMSTGALGQGLSAGCGMALGARLKGKDFRTYVVLSDGESGEGQTWEAAMFAAKYKLNNLMAILDYNKHTLTDQVDKVMPLEPVRDKWSAFGWHVLEADGHSVSSVIKAFADARGVRDKPTMLIAHTVKGRGASFVEGKPQSHSVSMTRSQFEDTLRELGCPPEEIAEAVAQMKEYH